MNSLDIQMRFQKVQWKITRKRDNSQMIKNAFTIEIKPKMRNL